ncbi:RHS repeat-associated core domain-containing protein [Ostreibacterium oceani]|uniref:LysR family transcriptional regulator n=1 Tax=Ostreibacterium oceani TaxID=2654998 RepID=A0A6N7EW34_9GAMM|nr:RHS repeat-associated core domain-containing protein [Ostreibacterium oceani]MPV86974.1 LysR family transcriptional regulator [Ostreibacterium oceani]
MSLNFTIKQLEAFVWLAALKNFHKTAEKLYTTQPAISSRIAALETQLAVKLFERDAGQIHDEEINLYQNYHRDYNPNLGRYLQTDPIGLAGGINTYGYARQNPLVFVDEDGLKKKKPSIPGGIETIEPPGTQPTPPGGSPKGKNRGKFCWSSFKLCTVFCITSPWTKTPWTAAICFGGCGAILAGCVITVCNAIE